MHIQNAAKTMKTPSLSEKYARKYLRRRSLLPNDAMPFIYLILFSISFLSVWKKKRNFRRKQILGLFMDKKIRFIMIAVWTPDHPSRLIEPLEFSRQLCNTDLCDSNRHHHRRHKNDLSPNCLLGGIATLHRSPSTDVASKGATLNRKCKGNILSISRPQLESRDFCSLFELDSIHWRSTFE